MQEGPLYEHTKTEYEQFKMPLRIHHRVMEFPEDSFSLHWHKEIEFIYIIEGEGEFTINFCPYHVTAGDIIIISPQKLHCGRTTGSVPIRCDVLIFGLELLNNQLNDETYYNYILPVEKEYLTFSTVLDSSAEGYSQIKDAFYNVFWQCESGLGGASLFVKSGLFSLYGSLFSNAHYHFTEEKASCKRQEAIKAVITYITENYTGPITIEALASEAGYSKYHFLRLFKECTGLTCISFINSVRLSKACDLLINTDNSISSICENVGIENFSYFTKIFSKQYHITPLKFRVKYGRICTKE